MSQQTLLLVEATGIQAYIFGSNQLAQNIGASELVMQATTDWVFDHLPPRHNVERGSDGRFEITERGLRADRLDVEVVYAGGGNAMLLFADDERALEFAKGLTRQILWRAPGLQLVLKRKQFNPEQDRLQVIHQDLRTELARRKRDRQFSAPLLGLGVTAACVYTGDPAVDVYEGQLVSAEVRAKLDQQGAGMNGYARGCPKVGKQGYEFVYDFDDFGTREESSYLAVIHTDGNAMGERIKGLGQRQGQSVENEDDVRALRTFSRSVEKAAGEALEETVEMLVRLDNLSDGKIGGVVPIPRTRGEKRLPFRPIVFGGDDVTFVCEGRLGLTVAAKYLHELSKRTLSDGKPAHCRAGVAVVKSHYPFSRAYDLAEDLCRSTKLHLRAADPYGGLTALDWHFAVSGLVLPLKHLREREYTVQEGSLLMRPVRLSEPEGDWRSWKTFADIMAEFQKAESDGGQWAGRRNKIIALRQVLRQGRQAVQLFLQGLDPDALPDIPERPDMKTYGWQGGRCGYFDAIEALDFHVPLKGGVFE